MIRRRANTFTRLGLIAVPLALTVVGVLFVHSTTAGATESFPGRLARLQLVRALIAMAAFAVVLLVHYQKLKRWAYVLYASLLGVLVLLILLKDDAEGARRWIEFPLFQIQPSELMKLAVILCLARYLCFRSDQRRVTGLFMPYALTFLPMGLVLMQPDMGTSLMMPPVLFGILFVAGARPAHIAITLIVGLSALPIAYFLGDKAPILRPYQLERLASYLDQQNPDLHRAELYQLMRSKIALGSGGLRGMGWGEGTQNTLGYLPASHTDFVFSIIGEEWGFIGAGGVALAFLVLVLLCFRVSMRTREPFGRLVAAGVGFAFGAQSFQNIAMTMGLTPITGLPLPFVSSGGSSLVSSYLALALVLNIASRSVTVVASKDLSPGDRPRATPVIEEHPAGTLVARWPT